MNISLSQTRLIWLDKVWKKSIDTIFNQFDRLAREKLASKEELTVIDRAAQEAIVDAAKIRDSVRSKVAALANSALESIARQLVDDIANAVAKHATDDTSLQQTAVAANRAAIDRAKVQATIEAQAKANSLAGIEVVREVSTEVLNAVFEQVAEAIVQSVPDGISMSLQIRRQARQDVEKIIEDTLGQFRAASIPLGTELENIKNSIRERIDSLRQSQAVDGKIGQLASADPPDDPPDYPKVNQSAIWLPLQMSISSLANDFEAIDTWPFLIQMDILNADIKQMLCTTP